MEASVMFESFTPAPALAGGAILGAGASLLLLAHGRISGVSGIVGGLLWARDGDTAWRGWFVLGLLLAGIAGSALSPGSFAYGLDRSLGTVGVAGLLVGFGTSLGNGCTSGHGVCGVSRLSARSIAATLVFMGTGAVTVALQRAIAGAL